MARLNERKCRLCKGKITGRADKKFCCLQCKNEYNFKLRNATNKATVKTDKILHRNRSILLEIMGKNKVKKKVPRTLLDEKHFSYDHITGYYTNNQGKIYNYVYDFAWMIFSDREVLIVRK